MYITKTENEYYEVFNQRMAGYLMQKGFVLIQLRPDRKNTGRNVFVFNNTIELREAVNNYMTKKGK